MGEFEINLSHLRTMSGEEVGGAVNRREGDRWRREVESKITLQLYCNKMSIADEEIYCNRLGAVILFQCRTNTLGLNWRQGFAGGAMDCPLGGAEEKHSRTFCLRVPDTGGSEGAVWGDPGGGAGGSIAV